ncbi:MAG: hypothetical protein BA863_12325 [Desulfovibrio sp. S3730MH75]|nr:MAG: hypothetical protein BA863_12325 [Desulfovibrio sp. S3730MH75]
MTILTGTVPTPTVTMTGTFVPYSSCMVVLDYALPKRATTQYIDYDFNSMVKFGDKYLGACDDGMFELDGDTDNGDYIGAYFEPITTDFGINNPKKVRFMFLGYEAEGDLILTLGDNRSEKSFTVDSAMTGQQWRRITGSRSIRGRYLTFIISNVKGCDFGFDSIDVALTVMPKGFKI